MCLLRTCVCGEREMGNERGVQGPVLWCVYLFGTNWNSVSPLHTLRSLVGSAELVRAPPPHMRLSPQAGLEAQLGSLTESESTYGGATVYFTSFHMAQSRAPTSTYGDLAKQQKCFRCLAPSHLSPTALVALCTHINALGHKPLIITCRHPRAACADAASSSWLPCRRSRSTAS